MRIGFFPIKIVFPLRCLDEVVEGVCDILSLFRWVSRKALAAVAVIEAAFTALRAQGPFDLVDVDVKSPDARVKIKILLR